MPLPTISIQLPDWLQQMAADYSAPMPDAEARMRLAVELSRKNVEHGGGPFGAAIFDLDSHRLVAPGVNMVLASKLSAAHAEMVAIAGAQKLLTSFDLAARGRFELATSCEPCAMCFGALPWSGIRSLLCGATSADAEAIGFDEGPRHPQWIAELERRGIQVETEICRPEAQAILQQYAAMQGEIYNGRQGRLADVAE